MHNPNRLNPAFSIAGLVALLLFLPTTAPAWAQPFDLSWYTIDAGGGTFSSGGGYVLGGTVGQPDASFAITGGGFSLVGGFWAGVGQTPCGLLGDIDGDGDTDLQDLAFMLAAFGSSTGDPNFNPAADIDGNGAITLQDLAFLLAEFGTVCP